MLLMDYNFWRLLRGVRDRYEARAMGHSAPGRYCDIGISTNNSRMTKVRAGLKSHKNQLFKSALQ